MANVFFSVCFQVSVQTDLDGEIKTIYAFFQSNNLRILNNSNLS